MKNILLILFFVSNIFASDVIDENLTIQDSIELLKSVINQDKVDELLHTTKHYIENIDSQKNRDTANELLTTSKNKASSLAASALVKIYCSNQESLEDKEKCIYWSTKAKIDTFDVQRAQKVTYRLNIETTDGFNGFGTAVAISSDGKLITAYHNVESVKNVVAVDYEGLEHNVTIGEVSTENDLAYLYIHTKNIPFTKLSTTPLQLGDEVYVLSADNLLLKGMLSQVKDDGVIMNVEIAKGTSGGGVFNSNNELVAIALKKDLLDNTSFGTTVDIFNTITDKYTPKSQLQNLESKNYDYSYCEDKHDLEIWNKYAKSKNLDIQEYHALFLGLCQKVKNRDLTTEEAQIIFEKSRSRLFGTD